MHINYSLSVSHENINISDSHIYFPSILEDKQQYKTIKLVLQ